MIFGIKGTCELYKHKNKILFQQEQANEIKYIKFQLLFPFPDIRNLRIFLTNSPEICQ